MWLKYRWYSGYAAFSSPPIFKESEYCSLEFYYILWEGYRARASLSVFIEELNGNRTESLWSTSAFTRYWKKKVIKLPQTSYNYSLVFLGYFSSSIVLVDDVEFIRCNSCKLIHCDCLNTGFIPRLCIQCISKAINYPFKVDKKSSNINS